MSLSFNDNLQYNDHRVATSVILESSFSKEIRILLKKGQTMREHKAPFPIIIHVLEGEIDLGVEGTSRLLKKGSIIALDANIPHDLKAGENSIVRLTLSKMDDHERVESAAKS